MWIVRFVTLVLLLVPFLIQDGEPLILTILFFPAVACSIAVAHQASDHEDEENTDFVTPVFWRALRESSWVFLVLTFIIARSLQSGWERGFLDTLWILAPSTVFALAGCYIGVLFTRESMTREAEAFGAAALTTAYLVVTATGLYYLLNVRYSEFVWVVPTTVVLVAALARVLTRLSVGSAKIGNNWPLVVVSLLMAGWTVLALPLAQDVYRPKGTTPLANCTGNLRSISTALEMYSVDWSGQFPPDPNRVEEYLLPNYLETMPVCPSSQRAYTFELGRGAQGNEAGKENYYLIYCPGESHSGPADYPRYSPQAGLTLR